MTEKAEEWVGRVEWMSKVNRQVEADRWRIMWELMVRPVLEHAFEVWQTGGRTGCRKLETAQMWLEDY